MKSAKVLVMLAAAAAVVAASGVQASDVALNVQVPFDFVVADQQLPSGDYHVVQDQDARLVKIYAEDDVLVAVAHWVPTASGDRGSARLVFQKCGDQRFLKVIRASNGTGAYLPTTHNERVALARMASPTMVAEAR